VRVTGIVLAGGRSRRFGSDKLAADLDGRPLLAATIAAVAQIADAVIVAGPRLPDGLDVGERVTLLADADPGSGPLVALDGVLRSMRPAPADVAVVVGGDMPALHGEVLRLMTTRLRDDPDVEAVLLEWHGAAIDSEPAEPDRRQVLPLAVRVQPAARAARAAVEAGHRSLRSLLDRVAVVELPASAWLRLDPRAGTLLDVDTPDDLAALGGRERAPERAREQG
jgi:molybdopterin-guanine dinucleotide biosynthesis protein A